MLKLTTTLFLMVMGMRIAFAQSLEILNEHSTTPMAFWDWKHPDGTWIHAVNQLFIRDGVHGRWLTVVRFDNQPVDQQGLDPCFTHLISKFKPVAHQLKNGNWEIHFECFSKPNNPTN